MYMYKYMKQQREAKKHGTIVESHRLRTSYLNIIFPTAQHSTAHDSTPHRNPHLLLSPLTSSYLVSLQENYKNYFRPGNHCGRFTRIRVSSYRIPVIFGQNYTMKNMDLTCANVADDSG